MNNVIPDCHIVLAYDDIYDDYSTIDPKILIEGIPTIPLLRYVVRCQNEIMYAVSDLTTQRRMLVEISRYLPKDLKNKVRLFLRRHRKTIYMTVDTALLMYSLALSNFREMNADDDCLELCEDEMSKTFKAIMYCNKKWLDIGYGHQTPLSETIKNDNMGLAKILLRLDLPISEFKYYKNFKTQLYKAIKYFQFCENDLTFRAYLPFFCSDHNANNWKEYLLRLFSFFEASLKSMDIRIDSSNRDIISFFNQYAIDVADSALKTICNLENGVSYLRNHFVLKYSDNLFFLLNANLLVDKIYQGLKFDFYQTITAHNLLSPQGKKYKLLPEFNSVLGDLFSETYLLYPLLQKCFCDKGILLQGKFLHEIIGEGEPDSYLRVNENLFIFEFKDLTLGDNVKFSQNADTINNEILKRLCCDEVDHTGTRKRKGGGQLLATINEIVNGHDYDDIDDITSVKRIFPIIITTDPAFSSLGVNAIVIDEFIKINSSLIFPVPKRPWQ